MRITKRAMREAAKTLLAARDRMNDGGKHWIKGAEKRAVDPFTHRPGSRSHFSMHGADRHMVPAYCSIGALYEEKADKLAFITLAELVRSKEMASARKKAEEWADREIKNGYRAPIDRDEMITKLLSEAATSCIVSFNDADRRRWKDVYSAFTKAAERLTEMARSK